METIRATIAVSAKDSAECLKSLADLVKYGVTIERVHETEFNNADGYTLVVTSHKTPELKIQMIKDMREVTRLGLKEAKDAVESMLDGTPYKLGPYVNAVMAEKSRLEFARCGFIGKIQKEKIDNGQGQSPSF